MTKDMTQGSPLKLILAFAVPLMLGSLFQQFYNLADTIIVGRFVGVEALAAVGSVGGLNYLVLGFVNGIACGFSIPISWTFGAKDYREMRRYTANAVWLSLFFAAVLTVVTVAMTRSILVWTNTPDNIIDLADVYIRTIFVGIPFTLLYNMTSALMRALGDSKRPLYFLLVASFLNIGLDLLCIIVFRMVAFGAAFSARPWPVWAVCSISSNITGSCAGPEKKGSSAGRTAPSSAAWASPWACSAASRPSAASCCRVPSMVWAATSWQHRQPVARQRSSSPSRWRASARP